MGTSIPLLRPGAGFPLPGERGDLGEGGIDVVDRRADFRVLQIKFRIGHRRMIRRHRAGERVKGRLAGVQGVLGNELLVQQFPVAVELDLGVF